MPNLSVDLIILSILEHIHKIPTTNPIHLTQVYRLTTVTKRSLRHKLIQSNKLVTVRQRQHVLLVLLLQLLLTQNHMGVQPRILSHLSLMPSMIHAHIVFHHSSR
jgi:hypothetical protein